MEIGSTEKEILQKSYSVVLNSRIYEKGYRREGNTTPKGEGVEKPNTYRTIKRTTTSNRPVVFDVLLSSMFSLSDKLNRAIFDAHNLES